MKIKNMSKGLYAVLLGVPIFAVSFFVFVSSAHAADFGASFSPAADAVEQDSAVNITISFDRAVYADAEGTVFTDIVLEDVVSLHTTNVDGAIIPFGVSINADNTVITLDPTESLADGAVYVGLNNKYYDVAGLQGDAASAIFFITTPEATDEAADTTAPVVTVSAVTGSGTTRSISATDDDESATVMKYVTQTASICDSAVSDDAVDYTEGTDIELTATDNDKYVCFWSTDGSDNVGSAISEQITGISVPDTTPPTVTLTPADGAVVTDTDTNIILTFSEVVYQNADGAVFDATALADLLILKSTDQDGSDLSFTASISADNMTVTVDPTDSFENGVVYLNVTDRYYDGLGNQGSAVTGSFTVAASVLSDTTAPVVTVSAVTGSGTTRSISATDDDESATVMKYVMTQTASICDSAVSDDAVDYTEGTDIELTAIDNDKYVCFWSTDGSDNVGSAISEQITGISALDIVTQTTTTSEETSGVSDDFVVTSSPERRAIITDNTTNISLTFDRPAYRDIKGTPFTVNDLATFVVLRTDDVYGYGIPFEASMSADNTTITIDPVDVLRNGKVYLAISGDYYDADEIRGVAFKTVFTVDADAGTTPIPPFDDSGFFTHFFSSIPMSPVPFGTPVSSSTTTTFSLQDGESLREAKIREAISLLLQALESLSVAVALEASSTTDTDVVPRTRSDVVPLASTPDGGAVESGIDDVSPDLDPVVVD